MIGISGQGTFSRLFDDVEYAVEMQATFSDGDHNPLWLNANKYGLSSVERNNGYLRAGVFRNLEADSLRNWGIGYGADLAVAENFTSRFIVQQAFVEGRYKKGVLTVGSKHQHLNMKNDELSSGSQTLGINARPFPQVRVDLPQYINIPGFKGWLGFRGHLAYGMQTDDNWQKSFTNKENKYTEHTLFHSKAGFLRIGRENAPLNFEIGLEMACQFGGTTYKYNNAHEFIKITNAQDASAFWHAFFPDMGQQGDADEGVYANNLGNHVGSWMARLTYKAPNWKIAAYMDHYFEDHSQMLFVDYDGYGTGDEWGEKKNNEFLLYKFKDCMWGLEATLPKNPFVSSIVAEYIYTKYQSGPIFHDHTPSMSDHIAGKDGYYNHYIYTGWQHWGQVIGNPLYRSPLYNTDRQIRIENNRFWAWHFGVNGNPSSCIHYRMLATWQKGWGEYDFPYDNPENNFSFLAEAGYSFPKLFNQKGWGVKGAFAIDRGGIIGDNTGFQLTISKCGRL